MTETKEIPKPKYPDIREVFYENIIKNNKRTPYWGDLLYDINVSALKTLNDYESEYGERCHIKQCAGWKIQDMFDIDRRWADEWINERRITVFVGGKELILTDCYQDNGEVILYQSDIKKVLRDNVVLTGKCHNLRKPETINIPIRQIQFAYTSSSNIPLDVYVKRKVSEWVTFDDAVMG